MHPDIKNLWESDKARYPLKPWLKEQSIWAVYWYRHGQSVDLMKDGIWKKINLKIYWFLFHILELVTGISLSKDVTVGAGLRIYHFGNIFIHPNTVIGNNCILRQGVTIGEGKLKGLVPVIGDNVEFGAGSMAIGDIKIGSNVIVGAMSLVNKSVNSNQVVVGVPAKPILEQTK
ncbi:serine O-acetyltransferase [Pseudoalteromonas sp. SSM20]|uniref:serine O-acetyltransferase n=1 Tax=Pseudoalteromonas sp. SSM20 TaxID=3139394 RepID=UPI003BABA40C